MQLVGFGSHGRSNVNHVNERARVLAILKRQETPFRFFGQLIQNGFKVDVYHDPIEGLEKAQTPGYCMILTDIDSGAINGEEIAKTVALLDLSTPVIILGPKPSHGEVMSNVDYVDESDEQQILNIIEKTRKLNSKKEVVEVGNLKNVLNDLMSEDGAVGVALVDFQSGMALGHAGGNDSFNIEIAGASNVSVVRAKMEVMKALKLKTKIEDILITLGDQYHLIRPLATHPNLFLYYVLSRDKSNLALARHRLAACDGALQV